MTETMTGKSANIALIEAAYGDFARGDIAALTGRMSPAMEWREAENFPYADGNPYVGPDAIVQGVFARIGGEWDGFTVVVGELLDAGDRVVMFGRYQGRCKTTGKPIDAQVVHLWTIAHGKLTAFQQVADTWQVVEAMRG